MTEVAGQGVGLSIVANYRDKLTGHDVTHHSREGKGSCFSLSFPLAPASPVTPESPTEPFTDAPTDKLYVVIVEDRESFRAQLKTDLHQAGYDTYNNVKDFGSVAELRKHFELAQHRAPNIIITDYSLEEEETAKDVLRVVDEFFAWETVPAVVYTAEAMSRLPFKREHTHLLAKSGDPAALLRLIQKAIGERPREEEDD
jgi:CheY-like chemotaxis protein